MHKIHVVYLFIHFHFFIFIRSHTNTIDERVRNRSPLLRAKTESEL